MFRSRRSLLYLFILFFILAACQTKEQVAESLTLTAQAEATFTPTLTPEPSPTPTIEGTPTPDYTYALPTELQTRVFEDLWNIVDEDYLYPDFNGVDWDAAHEEYQQKIEDGLSDQQFYEAMGEMINSLGDDHSFFLTPDYTAWEEEEYTGDYEYTGIGVWLKDVPERNRVVILLVSSGSPAEKAGLKSHDSILTVDGEPILENEAFLDSTLFSENDTTYVLTVQTPGEEPRDIKITTDKILGALPVPSQLMITPNGRSVGYILIPTFADGSIDDQVAEILEDLTSNGPLDGLIIDNRLNSGGSFRVLSDTLEYFTDGKLGYFVNRNRENVIEVEANDINGSTKVPLVVLVGERTASAGEIFAGVLQDHDRTYVIGIITDGNVEGLRGFDLEDGSRAWIAYDSFRPANNPDLDWERDGIVPDLIVLSEWDLITFETDPVILAALEYFDGLP